MAYRFFYLNFHTDNAIPTMGQNIILHRPCSKKTFFIGPNEQAATANF